MSLLDRVDAFQQRRRVIGFPLAVIYKFTDDQGGYLAALITYYAFVSLFPLLLLLSTILGFVLDGNPELQRQVLDSALGQFPVIGQDLARPGAIGGGTTGIVVGVVGALYGGLGVAQALQNALNVSWAVPRNQRPNPFKVRLRSLRLLATVGLALLAITALTAVANGAGGLADDLGPLFKLGVLVAGVLLNALFFGIAFQIGTARPLSAFDVAPGALVAGIGWQALQSFGATYVRYVTGSTSATGGTFAVVLGLLAFLYVASVAIVFCVELNVVRTKRLHPRSLLTPFTDDVELTGGDRRTYTGQAEAQRAKGFETIDVAYEKSDEGGDADDGAPS